MIQLVLFLNSMYTLIVVEITATPPIYPRITEAAKMRVLNLQLFNAEEVQTRHSITFFFIISSFYFFKKLHILKLGWAADSSASLGGPVDQLLQIIYYYFYYY